MGINGLGGPQGVPRRSAVQDKNKGGKKNIDGGLPEARAVGSADEEKQEDMHIPDLD